MDALRVVLLEAEIERCDRRHGAGDADRALGARPRAAGRARARDRVDVLAEALGQAHAADVEADADVRADDLELGRAAADVDDERAGLDRADPAQRQRGLLLAGQQARREAVAPLDLAEERLAVLGVADGARRDAERPLGAELLELAAVLGEDVAHAGDRERQQPAALVDPLAEPRDRQPADDLLERPVRVGDEQPGRVRPQVDGRDSHLRGTTPVTRPTAARTSAIAAVRTFSRAREERRRASDASSCVPLSAASARWRSICAARRARFARARRRRRLKRLKVRKASSATQRQKDPQTRSSGRAQR